MVTSNTNMPEQCKTYTYSVELYLAELSTERVKTICDNIITITYSTYSILSYTFKAECHKTTKFISALCIYI